MYIMIWWYDMTWYDMICALYEQLILYHWLSPLRLGRLFVLKMATKTPGNYRACLRQVKWWLLMFVVTWKATTEGNDTTHNGLIFRWNAPKSCGDFFLQISRTSVHYFDNVQACWRGIRQNGWRHYRRWLGSQSKRRVNSSSRHAHLLLSLSLNLNHIITIQTGNWDLCPTASLQSGHVTTCNSRQVRPSGPTCGRPTLGNHSVVVEK